MTNKQTLQKTYESWWLGKKASPWPAGPFKKVVKIDLDGPKSFYRGTLTIYFEDKTSYEIKPASNARPTQKDLFVEGWDSFPEEYHLYLDGLSLAEIGNQLGISKQAVSKKLQRLGSYNPVPKRQERLQAEKAARNQEIFRLYDQGYTMDEVAREVGLHKSTVSRALKEA